MNMLSRSSYSAVAPVLESLEGRRLCSISIQFDYRYDTSGFFASQSRRDVLNAAAASVTKRLSDTFSAVTPSGSDTWSVTVRNPQTDVSTTINNPTIAADKIVVFVGARDLGGDMLGQGGPGGWTASGDTAWTKLVRGRGQSGATATPRTDFAPKVGAISFNSKASWYFGLTTNGLTNTVADFYSTVAHELGHVLGIGAGSETWPAYASGGYFKGPKTEAAYGGPVPLEADGEHFKEGTESAGQEVALDPTLKKGVRKLYTPVDFAALDDIGYDVLPAATITGSVFRDKDDDGYRDPAESGISGVRVYLDADKSGTFDTGEISVLTNSDGRYSFGNLSPGTYRVREVMPTAYEAVKPAAGYRDITVTSGQTKSSQDFSIQPAVTTSGKITGSVFNDIDADGVKDATEKGFAGWRVFVDKDKDGLYDSGEVSVITDNSGNYTFPVVPGAIRLTVAAPSGYRGTTPASGYYDITLASGQSVTGKNFGFTATTLISGTVFKDTDGDGLKDSTESYLSGWRVYVDANKDGKYESTEASVLTDSNGNWTLKALAAGSYVVRIVSQSGFTTQAPANAKWELSLTAGQTKTGLRFAEKPV